MPELEQAGESRSPRAAGKLTMNREKVFAARPAEGTAFPPQRTPLLPTAAEAVTFREAVAEGGLPALY